MLEFMFLLQIVKFTFETDCCCKMENGNGRLSVHTFVFKEEGVKPL